MFPCAPRVVEPARFPLIHEVVGMLGFFSNRRVLIAFAILTAVLALALLVMFDII